MAIGRLSVKVGKAGKARPHAAYIARQGEYADRLERGEKLEATETGNMPAWAQAQPLEFWRTADAYERANGTTYREMEIALPRELDAAQRVELVREFVRQELGERHAYQWAIHVPTAADGGEQPHAHLMFSERQRDGIERDPEQYFRRYNAKAPERGGACKGYGPSAGQTLTQAQRAAELKALRGRWQEVCNQHLERAGLAQRIDMRSHAERGTGLEPEAKQLPSQWRGQGRAQVIEFRQARHELLEARQGLARAVPNVQAEVIDLEAARQARQVKAEQAKRVRRERAAQRRDAERERTRQTIRESIEQGARELDAWTAMQASPLAPTPAPAQAQQPPQKPQRVPQTPAAPVQSRQMAPPSVPRPPERAVPPVRQESPATPAQPQQRHSPLWEQLLRMSAAELRAYIRAHEPAWPESLATLDPVVTAAQQKVLTLEGQDAAQLRRQQLAEQEAASWRAAHPLRAAAHDRDWVRSGYLDEREEAIADAKTRRVVLEFEIKEARKAHQEAHAAALVRFQEQQAPVRKHLAQVEELRQKHQAQEVEQVQREKLADSMLDAARLHAEGRLNVANPQMQDMLTRLTADRRTPEQQRARMVEMLERDPHTQRWMQAQIEQLRPQLQRLHSQQQRHGPRLGRR